MRGCIIIVSACKFLVSNWSVDSYVYNVMSRVSCIITILPSSAVTFSKGRKRLENLDSAYDIFVRG